MTMKKVEGRDFLTLSEINNILDGLKANTDNEMDIAILEDNLDNKKIKRIAAERMTLRRVKNILQAAVQEILTKEEQAL